MLLESHPLARFSHLSGGCIVLVVRLILWRRLAMLLTWTLFDLVVFWLSSGLGPLTTVSHAPRCSLTIIRLPSSDNSSLSLLLESHPLVRLSSSPLAIGRPLPIVRPWSSDNSFSRLLVLEPHPLVRLSLYVSGCTILVIRLRSSGGAPLRYFYAVHLSPLPLLGCFVDWFFLVSVSRPSPWSGLAVTFGAPRCAL